MAALAGGTGDYGGATDRAAADDQYFLCNPALIGVLVRAAAPRPHERVCELGAGAGTVAAALPPVAALDLVELDPRLCARLRRRFAGNPAVRVRCADALEALARDRYDVVLSNLPRSLTGEVLDRLVGITFRIAIVAVPTGCDLDRWRGRLRITPVTTAHGDDFMPPQPYETTYFAVRLR